MSDGLRIFGLVWVLTQVGSLLMLHIGSHLTGQRHLLRLGEIAHRQKLRGLTHTWPLTRIRPAVDRGDTMTCTLILSSLIVLKSVASLAFGIVMVFWLPFASLLVPAIVAVHDSDDATLGPWVRKVATLQVTSHTLAAALGFAIATVGPLDGTSIAAAIEANAALFLIVSGLSLDFAVAAGRLEASGVVERGI